MSTDFMSRPAAIFMVLLAMAALLLPAARGSVPYARATREAGFVVGLDALLAALPDDALEARLNATVLSRSAELSAAVVTIRSTDDPGRLTATEGVLYAEPNQRLTAASAGP